jgi:hypothetical protein
MTEKFNPICITKAEGMAHTCSGHLIPCCYLDYVNNIDPAYRELLKDELKLSNNDSVEDILTSDEWLNFGRAVLKGLRQGIEYAPRSCQRKCGPKDNWDPNRKFKLDEYPKGWK